MDNNQSNVGLEDLLKSIRRLKREVVSIKKSLVAEQKPLYTNMEVLEMFHITQPTLRKWRNTGMIGFSKVGPTFYYSKKDIEKFLQGTHYDAFNTEKAYRNFLSSNQLRP